MPLTVASVAGLADALPTLQPLLLVVGDAGWSVAKGRNHGCEVAETQTAHFPARVFRLSVDVPASVETMTTVVEDEACIRQYDPTLDRYEVLQREPGALTLYTSYKRQTRFVAPRDFCVRSTSVLLPASLAQQHGFVPCGVPDVSQKQLVYVQNSTSCRSPACVPGYGGTDFVRGKIHVYGYCMYETCPSPPVTHVNCYCCAEAGGSIPNWVTNAAIGQTCEKLYRMVDLAADWEYRHPQPDPATTPNLFNRDEPATATSSTSWPSDGSTSVESSPLDTSANNFSSPVVGTTEDNAVEGVESAAPEPVDDGATEDDAVVAHDSAVPTEGAVSTPLCPQDEADTPTNATSASGRVTRAESVTSDPPSVAPSTVGQKMVPSPNAQVAVHRPLSVTSAQLRENAVAALRLSQDATAELAVKAMCALARARGWTLVREREGASLEVLRRIPDAALRAMPGSTTAPRFPAIRVSVTLPCCLDEVKECLRSPSAATVIDPSVVRIAADSVPRDAPSARRDSSGTLGQQWSVRHYVHDSGGAGCPPFDMAVRCTDMEIPQSAGATLGLHTGGVRAGSYVWLGVNEDGCRPSSSDASVRARAAVVVYGWTAVAVPARAGAVRLSHYALLDVHAAAGRRTRRSWELSPGDARAFEHEFQRSAVQRVLRLAQLVTPHANSCYAPLPYRESQMLPLNVGPLLALMHDTDSAFHHMQQNRTPPAVLQQTVDDVTCHVYIEGVPAGGRPSSVLGGEGARPVLSYHLTATFPCSVATLSDYVFCCPRRLRTIDTHLTDYTVLYTSVTPAETAARQAGLCVYHTEYGSACGIRANAQFTVMEASGFVRPNTFALSRVNCDSCGVNALPSTPHLQRGAVLYDGFVATEMEPQDGGAVRSTTVSRHVCLQTSGSVDGTQVTAYSQSDGRRALSELVASLLAFREVFQGTG